MRDGSEPLHNFAAEQAVLGTILVNNAVYHRLAEFLKPDDFAEALHRKLYAVLGRMVERGQQANPVTLKAHFEGDADLSAAGGPAYAIELAKASVHAVDAADMGRIVHELHIRRQ